MIDEIFDVMKCFHGSYINQLLNDGDCEVVAWMYREIPEPYKAEGSSET